MGSPFLENLKENNQFPIIFIGSGITQRYFKHAPTWDQLLEEIWNCLNTSESYYSKYESLKEQFKNNKFEIYTSIAEELEKKYNTAFYNKKVTLKNLTPEDAHRKEISPFKTKIAEIFSNLELLDSKSEEIQYFDAMIRNARMIITTNYDNFIEKRFQKNINIHIGNKGLFNSPGELGELYKIHGSIDDPNSIIITKEDYKQAKRNSAIINAKILSSLVESPILFIGYSLTDENIQSLLNDLSNNMPFSVAEAAKRIGVVSYEENKNDIDESIRDTNFGVHYTELKTDNYTEIYKTISKINQGISPYEIAKYQKAIKKIIEVKGKEGNLNKVLTSFIDLGKLPDTLKKKNLVVALGDKRYLYKIPEYEDYIKSYFLDKDDMPIEIALRFILKQCPQSSLPISKYLYKLSNQGITLSNADKEKINQRLKRFNSLDDLKIKDVPNIHYNNLKKFNFSNPKEFFDNNSNIPIGIKIQYYIKNINKYNKDETLELIKYILDFKEIPRGNNGTIYRKLFTAYSLAYEKHISKV